MTASIDVTDMGPYLAGRQHELFRELRSHDPLHGNDEHDGADSGDGVEFVHAVSARLPIEVLARILGVPAQDCPHLAGWSNTAHIQDPEYVAGDAERENLFGGANRDEDVLAEVLRRGLDLRLLSEPDRLEASMVNGVKRMQVALRPGA